jgi:hypothetical protein
MPSVMVGLHSQDQSITRPVVMSVIEQLTSIIRTEKYVRIIYPGDIEYPIQQESSIDDSDILSPKDTVLMIKSQAVLRKEALNTVATYRTEHKPVFLDQALDLYIKPVYVTTDVNIEFNYITQSKNEALMWYNNIYTHKANMRDINLHKLFYSYVIPEPCLQLLEHIYDLRESNKGYGDTLLEYFERHISTEFTLLSTLSGSEPELAMRETQDRVVGRFDFSEGIGDKPIRDDSSGKYSITLNYLFSYEHPSMLVMHYPIMVHNQLIDFKYVKRIGNIGDHEPKRFSLSIDAMHFFEQKLTRDPDANQMLYVPECDVVIFDMSKSYIANVVSVLCSIENGNYLFNLGELGDVVIDTDILNFIKESEYPYLTYPYRSPIHLSLYKNKKLMEGRIIVCDNNLDIRATTSLDERQINRIVIGFVTDLCMLDRATLDRLCHYPKALYKLLISQHEIFVNVPEVKNLITLPFVTKQYLDRLLKKLNNLAPVCQRRFNFKTVLTTYIEAWRA